jgi:class 3 adenylate cyclase/tetratricopeptide (TPR) repeat protein
MSEDKQFAESVVNNEESLQDLAWAIDMSQGQFSLILARCNYVAFRETLTQRLREICLVEIHEIVLQPPITTIYTTIRENLGDVQPSAVMVLGLESLNNLEQLLTSMNVAREEFRKNCPFPLVLWINDDISQKLIRLAPDFYSWATLNVFAITADILSDRLEQQTNALFTRSLDLGASQLLQNGTILDCEDYLEVQTAWRDLQNQGQELNPALQASLEFALGREAYVKDQIDDGLIYYQQSLTFWQQNNNFLRQGVLLFNIGLCHYRTAYLAHTDNHSHWQQARLNFQQCIQVFELEQRPDLVAKFISPLGEVLRQLKEWQALEDLATKSLQLHTTYATQAQLAQDYGFLAEVALCRQDAEQARTMSERALEILATHTPEQKQQGWYLLLLARSLRHLGEIDAAVNSLEIAKSEDPQDNPRLYIQILEELRSLYFEQRQYLKAFDIKLTRRSLEQQFGFRAFIGAGRLQPQRQTRTALTSTTDQEIVAEEIIASGRQRDITELIQRIGSTKYKLTVIHGQSGVGKSSLVNAGLVPALKLKIIGTQDVLPIALRVYTDWVKELGKILADALTNKKIPLSYSLDSVTNIVDQLTKNSECNLLTVLIFDQFEEFFFVCKEASQRLEFFDFLGNCLNIPDVKIVLSMREDYLHYLLICNRLPKMAAISKDILSKDVLYSLGNFLPQDAKNFIKKHSQLNLEPALIDEVVQDLAWELGEVRPIELQVVGAQMQTENITTLGRYRQLGPKEKLVQRYLEEIIKDCGAENQQIAQILLYLLTDEHNTRPLKTQADLEKDLKALAANLETELNKLGLVLEIFVKSGLVFLLPENPVNRYQLVHDYLVIFIRRQQEPQLNKLIAELETERKQRQIVEDTNEQLNLLIAELENEKKQRSFSEEQQRTLERANEDIRQLFGRYLTDEVVAHLLESPEALKLGGERRRITIVTSDLRGFTAISERLQPEEVVKILNFYLECMADEITKYQGTIDEFMGDGILVLFGAPTARKDDAIRAVACGVAMQMAMVKVNAKMQEWGLPPLEMGIGINTGVVVVGNIGSEKHTKYGIIGSQVNLTYRIEGYTRGCEIIISESTFQEVESVVIVDSQIQVTPKGVKEPINIYKIAGIAGDYNLFLPQHQEEL